MKFHFDPKVRDLGIDGFFSIVSGLDISGADREAVENFVREIERENLHKADKAAIAADPALNGFRELHTAIGMSNRKFISSPENLLGILGRHGALPRINPLVDVYNAVSVATNLALGAHDVDFIEGNASLRLTRGDERFLPLGAEEPEAIRAGEYCYVDDGNDILCRLEVRQVEKTKVTEQTKNCFFIVQGNPRTSARDIVRAHDMLWNAVSKFFGGEMRELCKPQEKAA